MWVTPVSMELTMRQRQAVTMKKALTYRGADRAGKSRILDELVELTALASRLCQGGAAGRVETEDREAQAWSGADVWAAGDSGANEVLGSAAGSGGKTPGTDAGRGGAATAP